MRDGALILIQIIKTALENVDWRYVTLSQLRYANSYRPVESGDPHWLERPFAYEIYHQLRLLWTAEKREVDCVIQGEVFKHYQEIRDLRKTPDILIHLPNFAANLAVIEIKIASNRQKPLERDIDKLVMFHRILGYKYMVEIVIGADSDFEALCGRLKKLDCGTGVQIDVLFLSIDDHKVRHQLLTR